MVGLGGGGGGREEPMRDVASRLHLGLQWVGGGGGQSLYNPNVPKEKRKTQSL